MADPLVALHKAIFAALEASVSIPVFDYVPQGTPYPYVEIERHVTAQSDSLVAKKEGVFTYITVWSEYKGQKEVLETMEEMYSGMHQKQFNMDQGRMVKMSVQTRDTARDTDKLTFTGNVKLFTLVEH